MARKSTQTTASTQTKPVTTAPAVIESTVIGVTSEPVEIIVTPKKVEEPELFSVPWIRFSTPEEIFEKLTQARRGQYLTKDDAKEIIKTVWFLSSPNVDEDALVVAVDEAIQEITSSVRARA